MYPKKLKEQLKNLSQVRTNLEDTGAEIDKIKANAEQMLKSNPHNRIYYFEQLLSIHDIIHLLNKNIIDIIQ